MSAIQYTQKNEQMVFVYCFERDQQDLEKVNGFLQEGWEILSVTPCQRPEGRSDHCYYPPTVTYLVVFERRSKQSVGGLVQ